MPTTKIPIDELALLPGRAFLTPNHAGTQLAYFSNESGRFELYVFDLGSRAIRQVTNGTAPTALSASFVWRFDDQAIIFAKDEGGNEKHDLFEVDLGGVSVTKLTDSPTTQEYVLDVFPDNVTLLVASNRDDQQNLYRVDRLNGTFTRLTFFESPVESGMVSPDGTKVAFSANESKNLQNTDVYVINADGTDVCRVFRVEEGSRDSVLGWGLGGTTLLVRSDAFGDLKVGVYDLSNQTTTWMNGAGGQAIGAKFASDGRYIAVRENFEGEIRVLLYQSPFQNPVILDLEPGVIGSLDFVLGNTQMVLAHSGARTRGQVLAYDLTTGMVEVLLKPQYGTIDPAVFVGNAHIWYPSTDGRMVPAILYRPRDIVAGARLPAVVDVHGGPTSQYFRGFNALTQLLVDQGYVVIQPNFRGSTGYGRTWTEANHMDWGGGDLEDVAASVTYLETLDMVDPERIAVFGASYGGYISYMAAVKKPDLFKVAIPWVGITDLLLLYEEDMEHFRYYLRQNLGNPKEQESLWKERSAIHYVDQLRAKLLIVHGVNDPRCPIAQARNFRDKLLARNLVEGPEPDQDFEYLELAEGHGSGGDPEGTRRMFHLVIDFLQRRL